MRNNEIDWKTSSMKIIAAAGLATSMAVESFTNSRQGEFEKAKNKLIKANEYLNEAIDEHLRIINLQNSGLVTSHDILFLHAEAQMTSTQTLIIVANEMVNSYKEIFKWREYEKSM